LGLANFYRRYITNFSTLAAPLTNATQGQRKQLDWGKLEESVFHDVKRAYTTAPVLQIADAALDYVVTTDANDVGICDVLEQEYDDELHPVAYASRKLSFAEKNYPTHDRELLTIIYAVRKWRTYPHGARFRIRCDHHPLQYLETKPQLSKRQIRWVDALAKFDYRIEYCKGKWSILSDAMSRPPDLSTTELFTGEENERQATDENIRLNNLSATSIQIDDSVMKSLINDYKSDPAFAEYVAEPKSPFEAREGILYKDGKLCVPIGKLRQTLMHDAHDSIVAGHLRIDKTIATIRNRFTWDGMSKDIAEYIRSCDRCQRNKPTPSKPTGFLQPLEVPSRNWKHVTMDFIMNLPKSKAGHDAILVAVDKLSKAMTLIPTNSTVAAQKVAQLFLQDVYRLHGLPRKIISDRDVRFTGKF
jgi:RNase H-like domain found in reverse transcriptase/Integrase zinc binding domain